MRGDERFVVDERNGPVDRFERRNAASTSERRVSQNEVRKYNA
jgi:hypothetical protein